jgi:hypothetical protein
MAKNRRTQSTAIRLVPALKAFFLCLLIGGAGVGYVWQKNQILELGRQITLREARLDQLQWENKKRRELLGNLQLPQRLEERVRQQRLGLALPRAGQTIYLPEPLPEHTVNLTPPIVAQQRGTSPAAP